MTVDPYRGASRQAIRHHYDVGNEFFSLWLDRTLSYSCALWSPGDSLESAQLGKLDYLLAEANWPPGGRVLDIGCGWGGLMQRAAETVPDGEITGLTLSDAQAEWVAQHARPRQRVEVVGWADFEPPARYDAIVSVEAFEHFARPRLTVAERVQGYRSFFARCAEWLVPGGRLVLQTSVKGSNLRLTREAAAEMRFINDFIFPDSELPWPSEILAGSERTFELLRASSHADDYVRTGAAWRDGLRSRRAEAVAMQGPELVESYERYLSAVPQLFAQRFINVVRLTFAVRGDESAGAP
ncbi:MAG: cyclopropane-fatty-acyl-phospholipid synthase family protein [Solirubrobacteraceae bacterium]